MIKRLALIFLGVPLAVGSCVEMSGETKSSGDLVSVSGPQGTYSISVSGPVKVTYGENWIRIEWSKPDPGPNPAPTPPVPPTPLPNPDPTPPVPTPQDPAPIPLPGLRVLVIFENDDLTKIPPGQLATLQSSALWSYLTRVCAKGPDGKIPEWRAYDKDADLTNDSPYWKTAMERPRTSLPWLIVSNGKAGFEGPLPVSLPQVLGIISKYEEATK